MGQELEIYIHIPFCRKKCLYCDFLSFEGCHRDDIHDYIRALQGELRMRAEELSARRVSSVFIGGGTPSSISAEYIGDIMDVLHYYYDVSDDAEITIEVNPGTVLNEGLKVYKAAGINRLSIGLQSANDDELKTLGRIHDFDRFLRIYDAALRVGFDNLNVDIMTAIPGQDLDSLKQTLQRVTRLRPSHISAYSLMVEEGTPFYEIYGEDDANRRAGGDSGSLPSEELVSAMDALTVEYLESNGYARYEISNYARKNKVCRHNIGYWTGVDYLGVGLGAASLIDGVRSSNVRGIDNYVKLISDGASPAAEAFELSRREKMEEFMFLGLRMIDGVSRAEFEDRFNIYPEAIYGDVFNRLSAAGLLLLSDGRIRLTEEGLDISNIVLAEFLL